LDSVIESEFERTVTQGERYFFARVLKAMNGLGGNLIVPIASSPPERRVYAFLVLDSPEPPAAWGKNWGLLTVFHPFFEQAGKSFGSLESFKSVRDQDRLVTLGEMAAGLAHEIRNPLGAIKGAVQVLESESALSENRFLKVILEEVDRLNRVVSQFLEYSKPSMSERRPMDLREVVSRTLDFLKPSIPASIAMEWNPPSVEVPILGSPEQIRQVLLNLIQNSWKACGAKGSSVRVGLTTKLSNAILTVEDSGEGIHPEDLDRVFIPFFTSEPSGTGLGLSICQKIIEAHQGQIKIESKKGAGTKALVTLPLDLGK
jgi:signal transduction histidine kinase